MAGMFWVLAFVAILRFAADIIPDLAEYVLPKTIRDIARHLQSEICFSW
jgi:hypothetical protein